MKYVGILRNMLLCAMGAWGMGQVLGSLLRLGTDFGRILAVIGLFGGFLGSLFVRKGRTAAAVMAVVTVVSCVLLRRWEFGIVYGFAAALLTFLGTAMGGYGFYPPVGIFSTLLLVLTALMTENTVQLLAGILGIFSLALLLDGCRERSLRKGQLLGQTAPAGSGPAGLTENSLMMTALFLLGAVVLAVGIYGILLLLGRLFSLVFKILSQEAGEVYAWLDAWGDRFYEWFWSLFHWEGPERGISVDVGGNGKPLPKVVVAGSLALMIALIAGGGTLVLGLAAAITYRQRRPKGVVKETEDYVDEVEWLQRPRLRQWVKNRFQPKRHYQGDMQIRYAFQIMLLRRQQAGETVFYRTPNELRRQEPVENALIDAYNRVRYGDSEPTAEELALADRYIKK